VVVRRSRRAQAGAGITIGFNRLTFAERGFDEER
jgi:hypothetical protein